MPLPLHNSAEWLLRLAIASTFLYPPLAALANPIAWIGYFPGFLLDAVGSGNEMLLLHAFGLLEVAIAVWVLSPWRPHIGAIVAGILLIAITVFNSASIDVLFRDVTLALAAFALAALTWPENRERSAAEPDTPTA